jgi:hypothetical protein
MPTLSIDFIAGIVSFLLTVMVLSYLFLGDNPLFRIAVYLFVGVSAGYAAAVVWHSILIPHVVAPLIAQLITGPLDASIALTIIPLFLGFLLLAKLSPRIGHLGNWSVALMVGVGTAVAIGGAVMGTLFPQVMAVINAFDLQAAGGTAERLFEASIMLVGTISTLVYFHFGAKPGLEGPQRGKLVVLLGGIGQVFIAITFGVLFAGVYAAALTALIQRLISLGSIF